MGAHQALSAMLIWSQGTRVWSTATWRYWKKGLERPVFYWRFHLNVHIVPSWNLIASQLIDLYVLLFILIDLSLLWLSMLMSTVWERINNNVSFNIIPENRQEERPVLRRKFWPARRIHYVVSAALPSSRTRTRSRRMLCSGPWAECYPFGYASSPAAERTKEA